MVIKLLIALPVFLGSYVPHICHNFFNFNAYNDDEDNYVNLIFVIIFSVLMHMMIIMIITNLLALEHIEDQRLPTDFWPHVHLFADSNERSSCQFMRDVWSAFLIRDYRYNQ